MIRAISPKNTPSTFFMERSPFRAGSYPEGSRRFCVDAACALRDGAVRRRPRTTAYPRMRRFTKRPRRIQSTGTRNPHPIFGSFAWGGAGLSRGGGPSGRGGCALGRGGGGCAPRRALPDGRRTPKPLIGGNSARNRTNARSRRPWLDRGPRPSLSNQDRSRPGRDRRARTGPGGPRAAARRDPRRTRSGLQWAAVRQEGGSPMARNHRSRKTWAPFRLTVEAKPLVGGRASSAEGPSGPHHLRFR